MPRSRYPALRPIVRAFAAEHGLPFKIEGPVEIVRRNIATYARVAAAPAQPGARAPRKGVTL